MKIRDWGLLFLLGMIWGTSFIFIRVVVPGVGPLLLAASRVILAGLSLLAYAALTRQKLEIGPHWKQFLVLGLLNAALPFALISFAELNLTASFGAILNATTPLFTALVAAAWLHDRLTVKKLLGLALGLLGVTIAVGGGTLNLDLPTLIAVGALLAACFFYALGAVYSKLTFKGVPPLTLATGQQLGATAILLLPGAAGLTMITPARLSLGVVLCLLALAVIATAAAYLIYFRLMFSAGPTATTSVTFIVPVFSLVWAAIFLGEAITPSLVGGFLVILAGLFLVTGIQLKPAVPPAPVIVPTEKEPVAVGK